MWAIGTLLTIGAFYADTRRRLAHLEKHMNGDSPFMRRSETSLLTTANEHEHQRIWERVDGIAKRCHDHANHISVHDEQIDSLESRLARLEHICGRR